MTFWTDIIGRLGASADAPSDTSRGITAGNPLGLLPKESAEKLDRLRDGRAAERAVLRSKSDALMDLREQHGRAQSEAQQALANLPPPPRGMSADDLRAKVEADGARFQGALDKAIAAHQRAEEAARAHDYLSDVEAWLDRYSRMGGKLAFQELPKPTLGVPAVRAKLAELDRAWTEAESAPAPRDDFKARALAEIDALAAAGAIQLDLRNRGPNPLGLRDRLSVKLNTIALPPLTEGGPPDKHTALHGADEHAVFLAWLLHGPLVERISKEIDNANDHGALSHADREARFAKLAEQRLSLSFAEESAIVHAAQNGQSIPRRRNADARAILQVKEI